MTAKIQATITIEKFCELGEQIADGKLIFFEDYEDRKAITKISKNEEDGVILFVEACLEYDYDEEEDVWEFSMDGWCVGGPGEWDFDRLKEYILTYE